MKKLGARLAALAVLLMIAVGCGSPAEKIEVGMTEQEVIAVLGEPRYRRPTYMTDEIRFLYYDVDGENINILFRYGTVTSVLIFPSAPEGFGPPE
ncbi:MAG: hypothetical protein IH944_01405 [Armatimonadetes bacterium]|nr:hypothetical protein [Armatimonadota bacterium]